MSNPTPMPPLPSRSRTPWFVRLLIGAGCLSLVALIFVVPVENWRGKRAWEQCKGELAARGEVLDWKAYIPPPVPEDQNIFKAPHMTEWFVGRANTQFAQLLDSKTLAQFLAIDNPSSIVADVTFAPLDYNLNQGNASLLLRYDAPVLSLSTNAAADRGRIISFTDTALPKAIDLLAHFAHLNYKLNLPLDSPDYDRTNLVTCSWTNVSPERVLFLLLNKYNLGWHENPTTGVLFITAGPSLQNRVYADPQTTAAIKNVIQKALPTIGSDTQSPCLTGPGGLSFVQDEVNLPYRSRFVVQTSERDAASLLSLFFTNTAVGGTNRISLAMVSDPRGFSIVVQSPCPAADYLQWSEHFQPQFTAIREALQRPYARRDGTYEPAFQAPITTFTAIRALARTLAQRAQCALLLGKPEDALRELTFIHDLRRLSDGVPPGKYGTLVSAMINAAVCHIYVGVVADGLRLHAWHDSQLLAIQKQLGDLNLCLLTVNGLRSERAGMESVIEMTFQRATNKLSQHTLLRSEPLLPVKGFFYQNQITVARLYQEIIDCYDPTNDVIHVDLVDSFKQEEQKLGTLFRPYSLLAAIAVADFSKAPARAAFDQTSANQARIACALERYRLAHGNIPDTLDALTPQFIEKLPHDVMNGQPLKYHRSSNDRFQLYSVGWNQTDDRGITSTNFQQGDWVWPPTK